jgi:DNA-3-methyladenine glycosylase
VAVLGEKFFARDTQHVAIGLLGKLLVHEVADGMCMGKVVETEAYLGENDPGAKGNRRVSNIPKSLMNPSGHTFIYFTYGNHWMFNITARKKGIGCVLIRAVEPLAGLKIMRKRRGYKSARELCNGPGKLTQAFGITGKLNGVKLEKGGLYFTDGPKERLMIVRTTRIGLAPGKGDKLKLRYYIKGSPFVSKF